MTRGRLAAVAGICALAVVTLLLGFGMVRKANQRHAAFMASCLQHRPEYECTYLWRASDARGGDVPIILPVPIQTGR